MIAFARHQWAQSDKAGDGSSVSDHLKALAKRGKRPKQDEEKPPVLMPEAEPLWAVFCALHQTRASGMGVGPISFSEIEAYQRLVGVKLDPWEVQAVRAIDMAYLQHEAERSKARSSEGRAV